MAKARNTLRGVDRSRANLIPDFKGSQVTIEYQGLRQVAAALAVVVNDDLGKNLKASHTRKLGVITQYARENFETDIRRPQEQGERGHARQTRNFTFGARGGGAFVGVSIIEENANIYGFGYPNIRTADQRTDFVWRSLEFGLAPHPQAISDRAGPRGQAKFPSRFTFRPFSGPGVLTPTASGSGPSGILVGPRGGRGRRVRHPGIQPKLFITRAFNRVVEEMPREYQRVIAETFKDFR